MNESTGMIIMQFGVPGNSQEHPFYEFSVEVYDKHWNVLVTSTVTIRVAVLSEEAVANSGAVRITGVFM